MKILKNVVLYIFIGIIFLILNIGAKKQKSITFWAMPNAPHDQHMSWMREKALEFESQTGIEVNFEEIGWGDAWPRISTSLATGYGVDCFQAGTTWNPQFAATGGLAELNIKKFAKENEFFKANLESCKLNEKYYGVPWFAETRCLFYNKQIFNKLRIKPPTTYDELLEVCETIKNELGEGKAISLAGTTAWDLLHNWSILLWSNGGTILNKNNNKSAFNSKEGIDALKYYINLFNNGYADKNSANYNQPQADADFISEKTAMCFMGPWNIEIIKWKNPQLKYGVIEPPTGSDGKASFSGGSNLVILDASPNKKEAEKWIKFLLKEKNLTDYCRNLSLMMPSKLKYFDNKYYSKDNWKTFYNTLKYATPYPSIGNWGWVEIGLVDEIKNALNEFIDGNYNEKTAEKYMDKAEKYVNKALEENSYQSNYNKKEDKSKKKKKERKSDVEITFWAMPNAPNNIHVAWMIQKSEEFLEETGIKVNFEEIGWGDAWPRISTALATGYGADCFQVGTTWNPQFAATGGLRELDIDGFGGENVFFEANLISCTYKNKYYGVPWFAETRCLFYNKEYFDKLSLNPPKTHDELIKVCEEIKNKYGEGRAISLAGTHAWDLLHNWSILLYQNGGSILNKNNTKAVFNQGEGVNAWKFYIDFMKNGYAAGKCAEYNQPQADAAFINGDVAMCIMGPWNIAGLAYDNPGLDYGIVEPPKGPVNKGSFSGGSNLVVLNASRLPKESEEWIKFLIKEKNMIDYCKNLSKMLPVKIKCFNDPYYMANDFQIFKRTLEYSTPYPPLGVWGSIETAIVDELKNCLADYANNDYHSKTVEQLLNKAAIKVNSVLNEK